MNKVILIGRLAKDIELRKTQSGTSVAQFTIAVNRRFKQEGQPDADFIRCIAWGKTADIMSQYLAKGSLVGIEGRIQTGSYKDKDSKTVYTTDVIVENFDFLESKKKDNQEYTQPSTYEQPQTYTNYEDNGIDIPGDNLPF